MAAGTEFGFEVGCDMWSMETGEVACSDWTGELH